MLIEARAARANPGSGVVPARRASTAVWVLGLAVVLAVVAVTALTIGPAQITVAEILGSARHHLAGLVGLDAPAIAESPMSPLREAIVWQGRAPRVIAAAGVGAGLALAGAVMQALVRNPLADPYLLGISSGASLGAVSVMLLGVTLLLPVAAFAGALLALAATLALAGASGGTTRLTPSRTVLAGIAVGQGCAALTSFVILMAAHGDSFREVLGWLLGSLGGTTWGEAGIVWAAMATAGVALLASGRVLDAFAFGDTSAASLGINPSAARWWGLGAVALLVGALVSTSGAIGFVGLVVPHAVRLLTGARHTRLLPVTALAGAIVLVVADTAARTLIDPQEIPVGVLTAALGAPVFALLLWRRGGERA